MSTIQTEEHEPETVQSLQELSQRSQGDWITVTCTKIEDVEVEHADQKIRFYFEYHHKDKRISRGYGVPDSLPNSDIKQFLDDIGYSIQNIGLLEGDELWYNPVEDTFADEPPSRVEQKIEHAKSNLLKHLSIEVSEFTIVFLVLLPIAAILKTLDTVMEHGILEHDKDNYLAVGAFYAMVWFTVVFGLIYFF